MLRARRAAQSRDEVTIMADVELNNVTKYYDKSGTAAVKGFNLHIKHKEFVVFVGPSGCGKSTTLRMIGGLEDISEGTIKIGGQVVNHLQPKDRHIAMVFQNYALYPNRTCFENIAFPLRLKKVKVEVPVKDKKGNVIRVKTKKLKIPNSEIATRVEDVSKLLDIVPYMKRYPRQLSGGQRQRVAIGRAMVRNPAVLLLDEPLSNLDAKLRNVMRYQFIDLRNKMSDTTFIYVTHDQVEAMTLADRIVIMQDGFIQQVGTPMEVYNVPANLFVAEFIGSPKMNTFHTKLERDEQGYFVRVCGVVKRVSGGKAELLETKSIEPQDIILGIRPEHFALSNHEDPEAIPCTITIREMLGKELHLHAITATGEKLIVCLPTAPFSPDQLARLVNGTQIFLKFESKSMHFFAEETKVNLFVADAPIARSDEDEEQAVQETLPHKKWRRFSLRKYDKMM